MAAEITATFLHFSQPPFSPSTSLFQKSLSLSFSFSINGPDRSIAHRIAHNSRSFYRSHRRSCVPVSSSAMNQDNDDEFVQRTDEFAPMVEMEAESRMNQDADSSNNDGDLYASSSSPVSDTESPSLLHNTSESIWPDKIDVRINCSDLPLSLRILKQKKKQQKSMDLTDSAYSAVKKAFSSMVFIVRELQSHTIRMRDALFSSSNLQIHGILARVHEEVHSSFVWLFQHIFSTTPTLMVYLMLLLANFTVFSITDYPARAQTLTQSVSASVQEYRNPSTSFDSSAVKSFSDGGSGGSGGGNKVNPVSGAADDGSKFSFHNSRTISPVSAKKQDDEKSWHGIIEEADRIRAIGRHEALMDLDTLRRFVSPVRVEIEEDDISAYAATDLSYRRALAEGFDDPLILCNFAQFLYVVMRDHDRAEEYFKRAALAKPADPEALSRYANFLWLARNDLEAAEETFLEAIEADPGNSYHSANYAHFLWSTGGHDTCYPLDPCDS